MLVLTIQISDYYDSVSRGKGAKEEQKIFDFFLVFEVYGHFMFLFYKMGVKVMVEFWPRQ